MPGVDRKVAEHRLCVDPSWLPIRQKRRIFAPERQKIIDDEIAKLLAADFIREIDYPEWLSNVVLVQKQNGKWRMCIDYSDLNKACPKDFYPLPHIDQLIDATSGFGVLSFMDAYSGYHQISMHESDILKTAFITHRAIYAYQKMTFGLLNAGATYQRMMNYVFRKQLGKSMEVYVDDMIVKSMSVRDHLEDLEQCFQTIRDRRIRLNPTKCTFGLGSGKFLGYLVSKRGIEANPEKIKAIVDMRSPRSFKDVQRLTGSIAALRRFMSKSGEKCLPFFDTLKGPRNEKTFQWTVECEDAFLKIKAYLSSAPLLVKPVPSEPLYLYLAASPLAVAAVIVREMGGSQLPVYYVSHVLRDAETRYPDLEKFAYALIIASRKLRHYFQGRLIVIYTNQPLKKILHKPDSSGRLAAWAVELTQFALEYHPRTAIKGQALADFVVECTFSPPDDEVNATVGSVGTVHQIQKSWALYVDGSSTVDVSGAGVILISPEGFKVQQAIRFGFRATNNEAEYEAVLAGLRLAKSLEVSKLIIYSDSQLVVKQISGEYEARGTRMLKYLQAVKDALHGFGSLEFEGVERSENTIADALARLATAEASSFGGVIHLEILNSPSIQPAEIMNVERSDCWMTPYISYLADGVLPSDRIMAKKIKFRSSNFMLIDGDLYRRALSSPLLKCLVPSEAEYALREVHEGICGDHMGAKALAYKILRQGYYWPSIYKEAKEYVKKCTKCQMNSSVPHMPPEELYSVLSPVPFAVWGIDILGPLPKAKGQVNFVIVAIDYMTKWVEAKPLRAITEQECLKFLKEFVVFRFGIPMVLVSDNGRQFVGSKFEQFLQDLGIQHRKTSVAHPQSNGQVEVTNRTLLNGIKRRLNEAKGRWPEELLSVLWAYRTSPRSTTGDSPFRLAYGTDALIPLEIGSPSLRVSQYKDLYNDEGLRVNLDLVEEVRESALERLAIYQKRTARHYNKGVRERRFEIGDYVLREAEASTPQNLGKLMPNWEGPYEVVAVPKPGTYRLRTRDGTEIKNTWHAGRLRKYYQ